MRSIALTLFSTLLLSPLTVLSKNHYEQNTHLLQHHAEHSVENNPHSKQETIKIGVYVEIDEEYNEKICQDRKKSCHGDNTCEKKIEACRENRQNYRCKVPEKSCHRGYPCTKDYKMCKWTDESKYGFKCGKKFFDHSKIIKAAELACSELKKNSQKSAFPALHTANTYDLDGPYFEWPFYRTGGWFNFRRNNKNRVVITEECKVVGGVIRNKDASYSNCHYGPK